jgi:hypothetical protein
LNLIRETLRKEMKIDDLLGVSIPEGEGIEKLMAVLS